MERRYIIILTYGRRVRFAGWFGVKGKIEDANTFTERQARQIVNIVAKTGGGAFAWEVA